MMAGLVNRLRGAAGPSEVRVTGVPLRAVDDWRNGRPRRAMERPEITTVRRTVGRWVAQRIAVNP
jgi:hypothetical protein